MSTETTTVKTTPALDPAASAHRSWRAEVRVKSTWHLNICRFETEEEAVAYAWRLFMQSPLPSASRATPSPDEPTHRFTSDGKLLPIEGAGG